MPDLKDLRKFLACVRRDHYIFRCKNLSVILSQKKCIRCSEIMCRDIHLSLVLFAANKNINDTIQ